MLCVHGLADEQEETENISILGLLHGLRGKCCLVPSFMAKETIWPGVR